MNGILRIGEAINIDCDDAGVCCGFTVADGSGRSAFFVTPGLLSRHGRNRGVI